MTTGMQAPEAASDGCQVCSRALQRRAGAVCLPARRPEYCVRNSVPHRRCGMLHADTNTKHVLALTELQFGHEQTMCQWKCVPHDWLRPRDAGWVGCQSSCMCIHNMRLDCFEAKKTSSKKRAESPFEIMTEC